LVFNIACQASEIYSSEKIQHQVFQAKQCQKNQKEINDLIKEVYKKKNDGTEFKRKPFGGRSVAAKKVFNESLKELAMEKEILVKGISKR